MDESDSQKSDRCVRRYSQSRVSSRFGPFWRQPIAEPDPDFLDPLHASYSGGEVWAQQTAVGSLVSEAAHCTEAEIDGSGRKMPRFEVYAIPEERIYRIFVIAPRERKGISSAAYIRMLFEWMVVGHVLDVNPAHAVRGPKHVVKKGRTPVLDRDEARALLAGIDTSSLTGLRDRALIATIETRVIPLRQNRRFPYLSCAV